MSKTGYVYVMSNWSDQVIYTGVTSDLKGRTYQHRHGLTGGFTARYNCTKLVYFEAVHNMTSAIQREKQIKNYSRQHKIKLISSGNPSWRDLYDEI